MILLPFYTCPFKISIVVPTLTHVREVVEYAVTVSAWSTTTRTHVFRKYLRGNQTILACSHGAQVETLSEKRVKNLVPLSI